MQIIKPAVLLTAASLLSAPAFAANDGEPTAPSGTYVNDPGHTRLNWSIRHLGLSDYTARVNDVEITLEYDAQDIGNSRVRARIDPRSVDTGYTGATDFDAEIAEDPRFLAAGEHPTITFESTRVEATGVDTARVTGNLTLLGETRPVILEVTRIGATARHPFREVPALGFSAITRFDRTDFGLDVYAGNGVLGEMLTIEIQAEFLQQ